MHFSKEDSKDSFYTEGEAVDIDNIVSMRSIGRCYKCGVVSIELPEIKKDIYVNETGRIYCMNCCRDVIGIEIIKEL